LLPEGRHRAEKYEERDEDVAGGRAEIGGKLARDDGADYAFAGHAPSVSARKASSSEGHPACISAGVPSKTTRPRLIKMIRSAIASTSCRMCVVSRMVLLRSISRLVWRTSRIWLGSRPLVASAMMST